MKRIFSQQTIESFATPCSEEVAGSLVGFITSQLDEILSLLSKKRPVISNNYYYKIVGEFENGATNVNSQLDLFIVFNAPQLELNTVKIVNNKFITFWNKVKFAYINSKKKKKSRKKKIKEQKEIIIAENKYTVANLKQDLVKEFLQRLDDKCYVCTNVHGIKLIIREYFGIDVNIYPVLENGDKFQLYNSYNNSFFTIDFKNREEKLKKKIENTSEIFILLVRVFNCLYFNLNNSNYMNQILIESLLYNCPDSLFVGDSFYEVFLKILNYLYNSNLKKFKSILDDKENIFNCNLINESPINIQNFIKEIVNTLICE